MRMANKQQEAPASRSGSTQGDPPHTEAQG